MTDTTSTSRQAEQELVWRGRLARHGACGQSVATFCRGEGVSVASFYQWRTRLQLTQGSVTATRQAVSPAAAFIDLGTVADLPVQHPTIAVAASAAMSAGIEVQLDFGSGLVLRIVRH